MTGLWRAFRGELFLLKNRKSVLWMHVGVLLVAALYVAGSRLKLELLHAAGGGGAAEVGAWNFWPQFGAGTRAGLFLVEIAVLLLLAGGLPREIRAGAVRDPLSRGISRAAFTCSRCLVAVILPITLYACALVGAATMAAILFDAGDIMEDGEVLLSIADDQVADHLYRSMLHAVSPLLALGLFSVWMATAFRTGVAAVGVGLGVMLAPTLLHDAFGDRAPWLFTDLLPGIGPDSFLARTSAFAAGFSDAYPLEFDAVVKLGWFTPWPAFAIATAAALLMFRRKAV
ncbi:MAG: hypothetical protein ACYSU1_03280 [Planctomycetota bacterium]|jgi:hypothetical protein